MTVYTKHVDYNYIHGKLIRIITQDKKLFSNVIGYCTSKPKCNTVMKGSGCLLTTSVGITMQQIDLSQNPSLSIPVYSHIKNTPCMYIPLQNIEHLHVVEKDDNAKLMLFWISYRKQLPLDITKTIESFITGWRVETPVRLNT